MEWLAYFLIVNMIAFAMMGTDKKRARQQRRRIRERTLFILALIGGSVGMYSGMRTFRHKTKHRSFTVGIPLIIVAQLGILAFMILSIPA